MCFRWIHAGDLVQVSLRSPAPHHKRADLWPAPACMLAILGKASKYVSPGKYISPRDHVAVSVAGAEA